MDQPTKVKKKSDEQIVTPSGKGLLLRPLRLLLREVRPLLGKGIEKIRWATLLRGGPIIALLFLIVYFSFASPYFASFSNLKNVAQQNAYLIIIAVGQTLVITGAGIDLSVGAVMAVSPAQNLIS